MAYINASLKLNERIPRRREPALQCGRQPLGAYTFEPFTPYSNLGNSWMSGLSDLAPEKDWQFDLGFTCERSPLRYGARGFYALIWDYILPSLGGPSPILPPRMIWAEISKFYIPGGSLVAVDGQRRYGRRGYQSENIPLASLCGGDLFAEWQIRPGFSLLGNISYVSGENLTPVEYHYHLPNALQGTLVRLSGQEPLPNIYPLNGRLGIHFFDPDANKWAWISPPASSTTKTRWPQVSRSCARRVLRVRSSDLLSNPKECPIDGGNPESL